ncbi:hypothetical protein PCANB_002525 [Pneumocystis canis]|nr:hypothetical protein PCK1_002542 [Pneumocystis canis]KAG5438805.1 hypothetical protein PCANB_002525 [Pneumocystis canis]
MYWSFLKGLWILWILYLPYIQSIFLSIRIEPHEKRCFYTFINEIGRKVDFYFAVREGGSFDINYQVLDVNQHTIFNGVREQQGDLTFTTKHKGEYSFCFSNDMSVVTDKIVDFEITVENEPQITLPKQNDVHGQTNTLNKYLYKISDTFSVIQNIQKHLRLRESRNLSTVRSTETRIFWFSLIESFLILVVSIIQVLILKTFFIKTALRF